MRNLALILAAALPLTAVAQTPVPEWTPPPADTAPAGTPEADTPEAQPESGLDLIERGVGTLFENLLRDVQPQMEEMARGFDDTFSRFAPVLDDLGTLIDDIGNYQAPERLPNGDILIRRLPDAPPPPPVGNALRDLTRPAPEAPQAPALPLPTGPQIEL